MKDYLSPLIDQEIAAQELAGASLGIWRHGEITYRKDFGVLDVKTQRPTPTDAIYRLYSATKPITAVATMILVERGLLDILDPVSRYLEGFKNQTVYEADQIVPVRQEATIKDLLNMTSGLVYPDSCKSGQKMNDLFNQTITLTLEQKGVSTIDFCNQIAQIPLKFHPGEAWHYGTSADILGAVIEVVTKQSLRDFLFTEIFEPLNMQDTDFYVPLEKNNRLVTMYQYQPKAPYLSPYQENLLAIFGSTTLPTFLSGGAGLFSTMTDYAQFSLMLLNKGTLKNTQILGTKSVEFLTSHQLTAQQMPYYNNPNLKGYGYGNLMRMMLDPIAASSNGSVGEFGWDGWAGTYIAIDPAEDLVIQYFISRINKDNVPLRRKMRSIVYGGLG